MSKDKRTVHYHQFHFVKKYGCGMAKLDPYDSKFKAVDRGHDTATVPSKVNCRECLEFLYAKKREELQYIAAKLGSDWTVPTPRARKKTHFGFVVEVSNEVPAGEIHLRQGDKLVGKIKGVRP